MKIFVFHLFSIQKSVIWNVKINIYIFQNVLHKAALGSALCKNTSARVETQYFIFGAFSQMITRSGLGTSLPKGTEESNIQTAMSECCVE